MIRFYLGALLCTLVSGCCASRGAPPSDCVDTQDEELLGVDGGDWISALYVERVLAAHGIHSNVQGSLAWSVFVPVDRLSEARCIVLDAKDIRGYVYIMGISREAPQDGAGQTVRVGSEYSAALVRYSAGTRVGRVLRCGEFVDGLGVVAHEMGSVWIESVTWRERAFITEHLEPSVALQGVVVARRPADGRAESYRCQVFD